MACSIQRPTPQELFDRYRDMFSTTVLNGAPIIPESNEWYVTSLNYAMAEEFYSVSEQQWKERDPRYACCENLVKLAAADGVYPRPATFAGGYAIITGSAGAATPNPLTINAENGQSYIAAGPIPTVMPSTGQLVTRIQATVPGSLGNSAGETKTGTLANAPAGIDEDVVICGGQLCGGDEAEQCEPFRSRYIARKQYAPRATQAWAIEKLLEWPCATRVIPRGGECCNCQGADDCDCQTCGAGISFYMMFDRSFACGAAPQTVIDEVNTWMFGETPGYGQGQMEIGVCGKVFTPKPFLVDVSIDIEGCATPPQVTKITNLVSDLFSTLHPSIPFRVRQVEVLVAEVVGAQINIAATLTPQVEDAAAYDRSGCGDILPNCDYLPCLGSVSFTNPASAQTGCT